MLTACSTLKPLGNTNEDLFKNGKFETAPKRYDAATKKVLGTEQDVQEIKKVIHGLHHEMNINGIRWMSPLEAVVYTDDFKPGWLGGEEMRCVLEKKDNKWVFLKAYVDLIVD